MVHHTGSSHVGCAGHHNLSHGNLSAGGSNTHDCTCHLYRSALQSSLRLQGVVAYACWLATDCLFGFYTEGSSQITAYWRTRQSTRTFCATLLHCCPTRDSCMTYSHLPDTNRVCGKSDDATSCRIAPHLIDAHPSKQLNCLQPNHASMPRVLDGNLRWCMQCQNLIHFKRCITSTIKICTIEI